MSFIIVVGNEKGGTGKSTLAMHLLQSLLVQGTVAGSIDLDARQATLTHYLENRQATIARTGQALPLGRHVAIPPSSDVAGDEARFQAALDQLSDCAVVVIDTPGADHPLSQLGHSYGDLLVTPLNDSLIDLDSLGRVDGASGRVARLGHYAATVWETKKRRAMRRAPAADWVVLRNRLSPLDARNKREVERLLAELSKRLGFRVVGGLGERVIYRELFAEGLTLLDLGPGSGRPLTLSQVAARQELRGLVEQLGLSRFAATVPAPLG